MGAPQPRPLRSKKHPEGFPWLKGADKEKVTKANQLADFVAIVALRALEYGIGFTIENPENSLIWHMPLMQQLSQLPGVERYSLSMCKFGSQRNKKTCLLSNMPSVARMRQLCSKEELCGQVHADWGVKWQNGWSFATASECEYPKQFCEALAAAAAELLWSS